MKFRAFTLAEVLIVLMVIGLIGSLSIPVLLKGIYQAQWRSGFKKAHNTIKNMYASEKIAGNQLSTSDTYAITKLFDQMYSNITHSGFVRAFTHDEISNGGGITRGDIVASVKYTLHDKTVDGSLDATSISDTTPWLISQDNMAYCVVKGQDCLTAAQINGASSHDEALQRSCAAVVVDVNGLQNSPNAIQDQTLDSEVKTPDLTSDRFYIYIGSDAATAGPAKTTLSGRMAADLN